MKTRKFLLTFYFLVNIIAFFVYLFGYTNSMPINNISHATFFEYSLNIILLLSSLLFLLGIFVYFEKVIHPKTLKINFKNNSPDSGIGLIIIMIQLLYIFVFIYSGGSVAGQEDHLAGGIFGIVMALFQIQNLSLIYLAAVKKKNAIWKIILFLFILSNIMQGWSSFILILVVMYLFLLDEQNKIKSYTKVSLVLLFNIILFYPIIYFFRLIIRIMGSQNSTFGDLNLLNLVGQESWSDFAFYSYSKLMERFEQYNLTLGSMIHSTDIANAYNHGLIIPYYAEGFQLKILSKFLDLDNAVSLGNFLPSVFYDTFREGKDFYNISPGFHSLFYTESLSVAFILPYYTFLIFLVVYMLKLLRAPSLLYNLVYFSIIILLFVGWFSQFFYFVWAIFIFLILIQVLGFTKIFFLKITSKQKGSI